MSDSACSSDIQYCQTFSTTLLWVDHWTRIIFLIFQGFGSSPVNPSITRMFLVKFSTFLWRFQKLNFKTFLKFSHNTLFYCPSDLTKISWNVLKLSFWNLHRNVENFTRNILVIDGFTGDEPKPWKIKNIILVQWSTHNKVVLKVWQYWISEEHALSDIIVSPSTSSNICWLSDFNSSENWLDFPDPQSILSSSDSLFYYLRLVYPLKGFWTFLHSSW